MALNREFFDDIDIEVVKKKYYNVNKVNALLQDIRVQALALAAENARLREELQALRRSKADIGETLISAQSAAKRTLERARLEADRIVSEARNREASDALDVQEHAAKCVELCIDRLKRQQMDNIEALNAQWQDFLCGLTPGESPAERTAPRLSPDADYGSELEARVNAIARELQEISRKN